MKSILSFVFLLLLLGGCVNSTQPVTIDLNELTIAEIHQAYRNHDYTSEQLVQAYLDRIQQDDSVLNAITFLNADALAAAKSLDEEFETTSKLRPLHGIPVIVKDNINVTGIPTTAGSLALQQYFPESDAFIITKLKEAGAIILAKSNMAEWAFSPMHTESTTHGTTHNPYNLEYVPAGSSGGTGASVAANLGSVGLGTDTGNSIRGPSSHCALVGFRTTMGLVSRSGIVPLSLRNDVVGPMCRTVEDAARVLEVIAGYDASDDISKYSRNKSIIDYQQYLDKNGSSGARIGVLRELVDDSTDPEIRTLFDNAVEDLRKLGAEVIDPVLVPGFDELRKDQWCGMFKTDVENFLRANVKIDTVQTIEDIIRIGTSSEFAMRRLASFANPEARWGRAIAECLNTYEDPKRIAFRTAIRSMMDSLELDAIIYPSWKNRPATITKFEEEYKGDNNQIISPHTGQPAFTVPMGYLSGNLPVGIQFLGRMYDEGVLIKLAYSYEQGTQHRKPPVLK